MTDDDQEYLQKLYEAVIQSGIARKTINTLHSICNRQLGPVGILNAMQKSVPRSILAGIADEFDVNSMPRQPKQIILTQYLAPKGI